jgi:2-C-methyl-D-erythritol 4-phosphate cytidylyltransferase/2-C-methyl-D-erythritol 2,4-cyclodiphosphate synthase
MDVDKLELKDTRHAAIIVAGGSGQRAGFGLPKQFQPWRGTTLLRAAVEAFHRALVFQVVVVVPKDHEVTARKLLLGLEITRFVHGGETRQESVRNGLEAMQDLPARWVLIHDAARPDMPPEVFDRLMHAIRKKPGAHGAVPVLPIIDSLVTADGPFLSGREDRERLRRVQTPQAFRYLDILRAHRAWEGPPNATDDAQVALAHRLKVALVAGDERLRKLTLPEDFDEFPFPPKPKHPRIGTGFDVHRLAEGEELWLCGVRLEHERGLAGHSDADVALHAVVDAILGAVGAGDIGQHFPPGDPQWRGAPSSRFVEHAVALAREGGYGIGNVDITVICEAPKIGPHRDAMRTRLAELLGVGISAVNVKATTTERLGFTGRGEGIAAQAVAVLVPLERI